MIDIKTIEVDTLSDPSNDLKVYRLRANLRSQILMAEVSVPCERFFDSSFNPDYEAFGISRILAQNLVNKISSLSLDELPAPSPAEVQRHVQPIIRRLIHADFGMINRWGLSRALDGLQAQAELEERRISEVGRIRALMSLETIRPGMPLYFPEISDGVRPMSPASPQPPGPIADFIQNVNRAMLAAIALDMNALFGEPSKDQRFKSYKPAKFKLSDAPIIKEVMPGLMTIPKEDVEARVMACIEARK